MNKKRIAFLAVLAAGIMWGCMGIFVRRLSRLGLGSMQMVGLRSVFASLFLFIFLFITKRKLLKIRLKDIWCFIGTGILSIVFFSFCYFKTILLTDLSVAAVLLYTAPAIVMIMSAILFKERLTKLKLIAMVFAFAGCVLVTGIIGSSITISKLGLLTGLGAGFGYALYSIFSRFAIERGYESLTITFYTFVFSALAVVWFIHPMDVMAVVTDSPDNAIFSFIYVIVSTVLPYILYTWGLLYLENGTASILASIEPVVATIIGIGLFGDEMNLMKLAGVTFVVLSIILSGGEK